MTGTAGRTKCAVAGSPVSHSLSPVLHRAAYAELGLSGWSYRAIECDQAGLAALLDSCGPDWAGLSLTMPLKQAVLPLLTGCEPLVSEVGAANTVVFGSEGSTGYNTDVAGMITVLAGHVAPGPVLILGAGATARSAVAALRSAGVPEVTVAARDPGRAAALLSAAGRMGMRVSWCPFAAAEVSGTALLISTVPAGAADALAVQLLDAERPPAAVLDVIYDPWPTRLAQAASRAGSVLIGGFDLLLHQAARQVELMTGRAAPVAAMRAAGEAALSRRSARPGSPAGSADGGPG